MIRDKEGYYTRPEFIDCLIEVCMMQRQIIAQYISMDTSFLKYDIMKESIEKSIFFELEEDAMWKVYDC